MKKYILTILLLFVFNLFAQTALAKGTNPFKIQKIYTSKIGFNSIAETLVDDGLMLDKYDEKTGII